MKARRQKKILELIQNKNINTQKELAAELNIAGFAVTQATVSRDIKELGLIKVAGDNRIYRYTTAFEPKQNYNYNRMARLFKDSVLNIDHSENLIIIKTLEGTANAVAFCIDQSNWEEIIGTIAGDDTILIVVKPIEKTHIVLKKFSNLLD